MTRVSELKRHDGTAEVPMRAFYHHIDKFFGKGPRIWPVMSGEQGQHPPAKQCRRNGIKTGLGL